MKKIFRNSILQTMFRWIHPDIGMKLGHYFSLNKKIMIWQSPLLLWLLILIPVLIAGVWLRTKALKKKRERIFNEQLSAKLRKGFWKPGDVLKTTLDGVGSIENKIV